MKHNSPASDVVVSETVITKNEQTCRVLIGDCIESMRLMQDQSVHCCVTSPPYFQLRDYGVDGQIGLEQTPEQFIQKLVEVFREVKRVLRDDGVLWVNIGDSYASKPNGPHGVPKPGSFAPHVGTRTSHARRSSSIPIGLKHKDLMGIPWMLAFALRADGWYLRQDIIWNKPNAMPESVRDRCTKAHEYVFLLSKSPRYFYDYEAIKEPANLTGKGNANTFRGGAYVHGSTFNNAEGGNRTVSGNTRAKRDSFKREGSKREQTIPNQSYGTHRSERDESTWDISLKNKRSVWTVATKGYKAAHFATFPPELIESCILAGCPEGGVVFDPFGGSGTTAGVAMKYGRNAVLCELNAEYAELIPARIDSIVDAKPKQAKKVDQDPMYDNHTIDMFADL